MKKVLKTVCALTLISVLLLSMISCSAQKNDISTTSTNTSTPTASVTDAAPTASTATATPTANVITTAPTAAATPTASPAVDDRPSLRTATYDTINLHKSVNGIDTIDDGVMRDITSKDMAKEMGLGINLGNTMEAYWAGTYNKYSGAASIGLNEQENYEKCWGAPVTTKEMIDGMYAAGFDTVRIPVYWGNMLADDGSMTINDEIFNRVEEIINYCLSNKLYVVINMHHYDGYILQNFSQSEALEIVGKLWTQIAERYKDYSDYLIFEGFNEGLGQKRESDNYSEDEFFDYVNAINKVFVDSVRATGGNNAQRMLVVSGYWTNIDLTTNSRYIMPSDTATDRLMVSVHYVDNAYYWMQKVGGDEWIKYTKDQCELLKKAFSDKGYAVFLGETTSIYKEDRFASNATITESSECLKTILKILCDYGFVPVLWDVNDNFYSRTSYRIKSVEDEKAISEMYSYIHDK